jgi:hypothetical protein
MVLRTKTEIHMKTDVADATHPFQLLDLIVVVVEFWKVLLLLPVIAAIVALYVSQSQLKVFESKATALMISKGEPPKFDRALVAHALKDHSSAADVDRVTAALQVGPSVLVLGSVVKNQISLSLDESRQPSAILRSVLDEYEQQFLGPIREQYQSSYNDQVSMIDSEIKDRLALRERLEKSPDARASDFKDAGDTSKSAILVSLTVSIEERVRKKAELLRQMKYLPETIIIEPPSAPILVQGPRTSAAVIFAAIGAGVLALVIITLSLILRRQAAAPGGAAKVARLRRALGLKSASAEDGIPS